MTVSAYIGLGANLGEREATIRAALEALDRVDGICVSAVAGIRETEPVGPPQPLYLNTACAVDTKLTPDDLLATCLQIEKDLGRERTEETIRWGPRILDLDVLAIGNCVLDTPTLTVPHPELAKRRFVLEPLAEIAPDWTHPVLQKTAAELLAALNTNEKESRP